MTGEGLPPPTVPAAPAIAGAAELVGQGKAGGVHGGLQLEAGKSIVRLEVLALELREPVLRPQEPVAAAQPGIDAASEDWFAEIDDEAARAAVELRERVLTMPDPRPVEMFDHVYGEPSPLLEAQRAEFERYHASFAEGGH